MFGPPDVFTCPCCRYHSLAPMYYRGAQAAIVVYDITNADTFERAKSWVKELQRQVGSWPVTLIRRGHEFDSGLGIKVSLVLTMLALQFMPPT